MLAPKLVEQNQRCLSRSTVFARKGDAFVFVKVGNSVMQSIVVDLLERSFRVGAEDVTVGTVQLMYLNNHRLTLPDDAVVFF